MNFSQKLNTSVKKNNSLLCIGLDTDFEKIPQYLLKKECPTFEFNKAIVDSTSDLVCSFKLNIAYYSANGISGLQSLKKTIDYIQSVYPDIPVIVDAKRADVGSTSKQYAREVFDFLKADAVTVNPYLGLDSIEPFFVYKDKGVIVLCRTSNPGAGEFQDLKTKTSSKVHLGGGSDRTPREILKSLYIRVAEKIVVWDKKYGNCFMVVGATWPKELREIRKIAPKMWLLIPGVGAQGGDLEKTLEYGLTKQKNGLIIHSARAIIYASKETNFAEAAREKAMELKNEINKYRNL